MSYPSMYLRNINKKQIRSLFSNLLIPGQDHRWLEPILTAQGTRRSHPGQAPSNRGSLTPTPSLPPTGTMQTHQFTSQARLWAVGGNQSPRKKTHTEVGRMGELHTESGSIWESIFFPSHQCYKERTLFKDLLHCVCFSLLFKSLLIPQGIWIKLYC